MLKAMLNLFRPAPRNAIFTIPEVVKKGGIWCFDVPEWDVYDEALIAGMPEIIEYHLKKLKIREKRFSVTFGNSAFPGHNVTLLKGEPEEGGTWYTDEESEQEGWLCPFLFYYFKKAPEVLYAQVTACA